MQEEVLSWHTNNSRTVNLISRNSFKKYGHDYGTVPKRNWNIYTSLTCRCRGDEMVEHSLSLLILRIDTSFVFAVRIFHPFEWVYIGKRKKRYYNVHVCWCKVGSMWNIIEKSSVSLHHTHTPQKLKT